MCRFSSRCTRYQCSLLCYTLKQTHTYIYLVEMTSSPYGRQKYTILIVMFVCHVQFFGCSWYRSPGWIYYTPKQTQNNLVKVTSWETSIHSGLLPCLYFTPHSFGYSYMILSFIVLLPLWWPLLFHCLLSMCIVVFCCFTPWTDSPYSAPQAALPDQYHPHIWSQGLDVP